LAEFVSKSIDNLAQDMHVKDGMKYLGLRESVLPSLTYYFVNTPPYVSAKDILPGLEVRLIPHQIIGVSW
jgi:hypothetical protein